MVNSNIERIQWHSGLLLILLPTLILAHLSLLGQEEDPLENGAILSYSESLTLVCPPLSEWRINGTKPASQESTLSFSSPPQSTLKIECLSSNKSEGSVSYSFLYLSQLNETLDPPPPISSLSLKPKTVLTYEETTSLTCSLDETQDEGVSYSFVWLKNGEIVSESSGSTFLLRNVTQSATYGCLLKDKDLSSLAYEETHVLVPSKIISPKENEQTIYLLPGSSYKEVCTANTPSVKWIQNGEALSVSSEFILQNVSEDTDLICIADNELGQDERKIHLIVVSPSVGPETQKINIYQDESKDLTCKAEIDERLISSSLLHYKWYLNGSLLENDGKDHFRIDSASDGDISGNYTCVIETPVEDVKVEYNVLVVSAPVIDSQFSKTLKVLKKSPYPSVQCSAHGDPEPRVSWIWSVDDKEVIVNESTLLSLNTSLAIDSTIFTCQAESVHGLTQRNFTLRAFEPTFVLQNDTTISVNASGKVILKCESAVDPRLESSSSITWLKDNKPLQHFITKDDEVLIPYLHLDHGGMYSCLTRTPLESVLVVQKLVVLVETPVIKLPVNVKRVTEGSDVSITCNASGVPHPSIHWKKDADNIKVSDGENLIIRHIGVEDTGHYSCLAVNEYGSKQESLSIEVYNKTTVAVDKETLISETSDLVVLECPVRLDKRLNIVSITWYKDGLNESISNETKLVIRNATKEDQGTYICRVETPVDVVNQTLRLTVLSEGPSFLSTEEDIRTLEGTNVTVNCQANGLPIPKISWTNNGVQILKGDDRRTVSPLGDLTIHYVSLNDQGNYTCTATNIYGSISTQSTIEVILRSKMATDFKKVKNVIKNVRENVVLDCDVVYDSRLDREIELLWKKDNLPIRINRSKYIAADNSLKVYNLDISDQGTYECQVNTPFESISSKTALIVSGEPPKIVSEFKKVMLDEGEDLRLECLVRGVPRPTLVWYFQDAPLTNAYVHEIATASKVFRESRVIVKNVTKANDGVYQCRADNDYGTGVAKFSRVNVLRRTRATISESGEISIHAGTNLKIPCNIEKDQMNQITNIQWVKPFKVGAKDRIDFGVDGSLSIQDVQKRHSGEYKCLVTTILDKANSSVTVSVNVNAPFITSFTGENQMIFQGESLSLFCNSNGIPKPIISWNFNKTDTKIDNNAEFKILNAIASDSGSYECVAKNQYGETRKIIFVRVIQVPPVDEEVAVDDGEPADLYCIKPNNYVHIQWRDPKEQNISDYDSETGVLHFKSVNQENIGEYSCIISLNNGRSRAIKRHLRIKPEIIMSRNNTLVEITEGKNLTLECNVLPGIGAKRLWKHNENIIIPGGNREVSNRGGLLTIEDIRQDEDSGKYVCIAIADFGKDTIEYTVHVDPIPVSKKEVSCTESHSNPIFLFDVIRTGNESVLIRWEFPDLFNTSCYEALFLTWWTDEKDSPFSEEFFSFSTRKTTLTGLDENLHYYVQINLKEKTSSKSIFGETRSFYLRDLPFESISNLDSNETSSDFIALLSSTSIVILISILFVLLILIAAVSFLYYKNKLVCCGHHFGNDSKIRKRTNIYNPDFRDFQLIQSPARGIDDFMQNLAPQWPEPEPPAKLGGDEDDESAAFIKIQQPSQNNMQQSNNSQAHHHHHHNRHPSQNNSISSSWSSLFNMPIDPATVRMNANNKSRFSGFVT